MKNLLYLHGLDSFLSDEKRLVLSQYFNVISPKIDYLTDDVNEILADILNQQKIDCIMGSSMGGYVGYHLSRKLHKNCLLFNPAMLSRSLDINFEAKQNYAFYSGLMCVLLGKKDDIIPFKNSYELLIYDDSIAKINFIIHSNLGHRIDLKTFEEAVWAFYALLNNQ